MAAVNGDKKIHVNNKRTAPTKIRVWSNEQLLE